MFDEKTQLHKSHATFTIPYRLSSEQKRVGENRSTQYSIRAPSMNWPLLQCRHINCTIPKRARTVRRARSSIVCGQIVSRAWSLAGSDYSGVVFFTGKEDFADGDGKHVLINRLIGGHRLLICGHKL